MKTPVIIPAHNEAGYIAGALRSLDAAQVEPIVAINGEQRDVTATVAEQFGATVQVIPEQGQLNAIQRSVECLGDRALEPFLLMDADSHPLRPKEWPQAMLRGISPERPEVINGSLILNEVPLYDGLIRSVKWYVDDERARRNGTARTHGANMGLFLRDKQTRQTFCEMPSVHYGNDVYMRETIVAAGGISRQVTHPNALMVTSGRYVQPLWKRVILGQSDFNEKTFNLRSTAAAEISQ